MKHLKKRGGIEADIRLPLAKIMIKFRQGCRQSDNIHAVFWFLFFCDPRPHFTPIDHLSRVQSACCDFY